MEGSATAPLTGCRWFFLAPPGAAGVFFYRMAWLVLLLLAVSAGAQAPPPPAAPNRVVAGVTAPDFELPSAAGGSVRLGSLRGKNVVLVFYRGYW